MRSVYQRRSLPRIERGGFLLKRRVSPLQQVGPNAIADEQAFTGQLQPVSFPSEAPDLEVTLDGRPAQFVNIVACLSQKMAAVDPFKHPKPEHKPLASVDLRGYRFGFHRRRANRADRIAA